MMGHHARSESLFYDFRLEDHVPEDHLLRLVDKHIDFGFLRERLKDSYSETGRPSIDSELLLRILLIGYLYGISSERETSGPHRSSTTHNYNGRRSRCSSRSLRAKSDFAGSVCAG